MTIEVEWRRLRADELRARAAEDAVVIVPLGALEQHGPHLPVEVDAVLGEAVALRAAADMVAMGERVVVLPMFWPGVSEHHMGFGGTITLDIATYGAVIEAICRSVQRHGFSRVVLLNAHGGNDNPLRAVVDDLTPKLGLPIVQFTYWYAAADAIAAILETQPGLQHACEAETSMMMAVRPEAVAAERIALARGQNTPEAEGGAGPGVYRWRAIASRSLSGVIGHPEAATPEKGERLLSAIARVVADRLCDPALWATPWQDVAAR